MRALGVIGTLVLAGGTTLAALVPLDTAHAGTLSVIHVFTGGSDGANPSGLMEDAAGNLYGTTGEGGSYVCFGGGTVFKIAPTARKPCSTLSLVEAMAVYLQQLDRGQGRRFYGTRFTAAEPAANTVLVRYCFQARPRWHGNCALCFHRRKRRRLCQCRRNRGRGRQSYGTAEQGGEHRRPLHRQRKHRLRGGFQNLPKGKETTLYAFQGGTDGNVPFSGLMKMKRQFVRHHALGRPPRLYLWMRHHFQARSDGTETVLQLSSTGQTVLNLGWRDQGRVRQPLRTTPSGGPYNKGTVFRLAPTHRNGSPCVRRWNRRRPFLGQGDQGQVRQRLRHDSGWWRQPRGHAFQTRS